jgi:cell cycle checkpoint protein
LITSSTAASDSFTAHRLLGPQVLGHPGVTIIEFNTIAPTLLVKALNLVIQKEARQSGRRRTPGPAVIKSLAEVGDIRSAIGSLEFLCLRGDKDGDWGGRVAAKGKTGANNAVALTKMEKQSIELITQRESTLDIFHAVGKVVYNKRKTPAEAGVEPPEKPPEHLVQFHRPLIPEVDVERLMDETGTDIETFLAALHENYVLSCDGDDALDSLVGCIDALSDSDVLITNRAATGGGFGNFYQSNFQGGGLDLLRQSELSFHVAVRGIQFALPHPVKRRAQPGPGGARDAFKMFYPTSMRLWKQEQEVTGLVDAWADLSLARTSSMAATTGVVESWKNKNSNLLSAKDLRESECSAPQASFLLGSSSARAEMLLERLPYIAKITRQSKDSARTTELQRITKFEGIQPAPEDVEVEDEASREFGSDLVGIPRASDVTSAGFSNAVPTGKAIQELIIAEDDIEDD